MMATSAASLIGPMASSLIQHVASSLVNAITGKGVTKTKKMVFFRFYRHL